MFSSRVHLVVALTLIAQTIAQIDSLTITDGPEATGILDQTGRGMSTCGYIDGDPESAVTCSSLTCGILYVFGRGNAHAGCCGSASCDIPTTCIEFGTASGRNTVECTEGSLSACATYTWPELSAEAYFCAESRTTETLVTATTDDETYSTWVTDIDPSMEPTVEPSAGPTVTSGTPPDDDGGPNLGWEHDLSSRQRVGAGIGSGISGGLLLIFFAIRLMPLPAQQSGDDKTLSLSQGGLWEIEIPKFNSLGIIEISRVFDIDTAGEDSTAMRHGRARRKGTVASPVSE
ncbi:hypothetical protein FDECE_12314 [Fusarium decemcellulare]|nr:hypothetical protein FDECE_12314 [Fusarium decemcellulare]